MCRDLYQHINCACPALSRLALPETRANRGALIAGGGRGRLDTPPHQPGVVVVAVLSPHAHRSALQRMRRVPMVRWSCEGTTVPGGSRAAPRRRPLANAQRTGRGVYQRDAREARTSGASTSCAGTRRTRLARRGIICEHSIDRSVHRMPHPSGVLGCNDKLLMQKHGTCWFNAPFNALLIGKNSTHVLAHALSTYLKERTDGEREEFFTHVQRAFDTCAKPDPQDTRYLFVAIASLLCHPHIPAVSKDNGATAKIMSSLRMRRKPALIVDGWWAYPALVRIFGALGVTYERIKSGARASASAQVLIVKDVHPPENGVDRTLVSSSGETYILDHAVLHVQDGILAGHYAACGFCDTTPVIHDGGFGKYLGDWTTTRGLRALQRAYQASSARLQYVCYISGSYLERIRSELEDDVCLYHTDGRDVGHIILSEIRRWMDEGKGSISTWAGRETLQLSESLAVLFSVFGVSFWAKEFANGKEKWVCNYSDFQRGLLKYFFNMRQANATLLIRLGPHGQFKLTVEELNGFVGRALEEYGIDKARQRANANENSYRFATQSHSNGSYSVTNFGPNGQVTDIEHFQPTGTQAYNRSTHVYGSDKRLKEVKHADGRTARYVYDDDAMSVTIVTENRDGRVMGSATHHNIPPGSWPGHKNSTKAVPTGGGKPRMKGQNRPSRTAAKTMYKGKERTVYVKGAARYVKVLSKRRGGYSYVRVP